MYEDAISRVLGTPIFSIPEPFAMLSREIEKLAGKYGLDSELKLEATRGLIKGYTTEIIFSTPTGKKVYTLEIEKEKSPETLEKKHTTRAVNELDALTSMLGTRATPYFMGFSSALGIDLPGGEQNVPRCMAYSFNDRDLVPYLVACIEYTGTGLGKPFLSTRYYYTRIELDEELGREYGNETDEFPSCGLGLPKETCPLYSTFQNILGKHGIRVKIDNGPLSFEDVLEREGEEIARRVAGSKLDKFFVDVRESARRIGEEIIKKKHQEKIRFGEYSLPQGERDVMYG